jgi:hypothetical protein
MHKGHLMHGIYEEKYKANVNFIQFRKYKEIIEFVHYSLVTSNSNTPSVSI